MLARVLGLLVLGLVRMRHPLSLAARPPSEARR